MKILILESDKVFARSLQTMVELAGHTVFHANEAQSAIVAVDIQKPDAIITDLLLAGHSGAEFLYELRSYPEWQGLPVYILSSVPASESCVDTNCFSELNIKEFFYKPATNLSQIVGALEPAKLAAI